MKATRILQGRREGELLAFPSVSRMAEILSLRCREPSWVRTSVASLERFRTMTGNLDLEVLRERALAEPLVAEQALASFASVLVSYTDIQVSSLAMGPKLWFRFNGIAVPWRPLPGVTKSSTFTIPNQLGPDQIEQIRISIMLHDQPPDLLVRKLLQWFLPRPHYCCHHRCWRILRVTFFAPS